MHAASAGQLLGADGSLYSGAIVIATFAPVNFANTSAEETLFSFSVPANLLGSNGQLLWSYYGATFNNSGAGRNFQFKLKVGSTAYIDATQPLGAGATTWGLWHNYVFKNYGATNVNYAALNGIGIADWAAVTTGAGTTGIFGAASQRPMGLQTNGSMAIDTTATITISATIQMATASANLWIKHWGGNVLLLPA